MQHRVFIKAYEAVSIAGYGIDEIFENLLNKRCFITEDNEFCTSGKPLCTGRINEFDKAQEFCVAIGGANTPTFATLKSAVEALQSQTTKEALVVASYRLNKEEITKINQNGRYSHSVAKPFDIESAGLNAAEATAAILLSTQNGDLELLGIGEGKDAFLSIGDALANSQLKAEEIEYIEAAASGVLSEDAAEAEALSQIFGQKPLVSSSKGLTGHTFDASMLLSVAIAAKAMNEGIIPASSFLEHSFTNKISLAYANKIKKIGKAIVNSNEANRYSSVVLSAN